MITVFPRFYVTSRKRLFHLKTQLVTWSSFEEAKHTESARERERIWLFDESKANALESLSRCQLSTLSEESKLVIITAFLPPTSLSKARILIQLTNHSKHHQMLEVAMVADELSLPVRRPNKKKRKRRRKKRTDSNGDQVIGLDERRYFKKAKEKKHQKG